MPELFTAMLEMQIKQNQEARMDKLYDKMLKGQSVNSFAQFCKSVEQSEFLSEALKDGDYSTIDKVIEMQERLAKAF